MNINNQKRFLLKTFLNINNKIKDIFYVLNIIKNNNKQIITIGNYNSKPCLEIIINEEENIATLQNINNNIKCFIKGNIEIEQHNIIHLIKVLLHFVMNLFINVEKIILIDTSYIECYNGLKISLSDLEYIKYDKTFFEKYLNVEPDHSNILLINFKKNKLKNSLNQKINMKSIDFINLNEEYLKQYLNKDINIDQILKKLRKYYRENIFIKEFLYNFIFKDSCIYYAFIINVFIGKIFNNTKWNIYREDVMKFTSIYSFIEIECNLTNNKIFKIINNYNNGLNNKYKINNINDLLRKVYGEVILKKGSILYHTSDENKNFIRINENEKPFLFCVFHPSEWGASSIKVTKVCLKKDISLFFMIHDINKLKITSELNKLIYHENKNLSKQNIDVLKCLSEYLKKDNFDGWFSSIENKNTIEISLINNDEIFEILVTEKLKKKWKNSNEENNGIKVLKQWGSTYPICSIEFPLIFNINIIYKKLIDDYLEFEKISEYINDTAFQVILKNAIINYHEYNFINIQIKC